MKSRKSRPDRGESYEGTEFSAAGDAVHHLNPPPGVTADARHRSLDLLRRLNAEQLRQNQRRSELEVRIQNYELAARMQLEASQVLDVSGETEATRRLYGLDDKVTENYGKRCLLARGLAEAGVRFVQVFHRCRTINRGIRTTPPRAN